MTQPTQGSVYVDPVLTNISVAYMQRADRFVAGKVFPNIPVQLQSGKYPIYPRGNWFRDDAKPRADSTESAGSGYTLDFGDYRADVWAIHKDIGEQVAANYPGGMAAAERDATAFVTQQLLIRQERQWVADYFVAGKWGTDVTPTNEWNDYTLGDPVGDIETGKEAIHGVTGIEPNTLVVGRNVHRYLRNHPDVADRYKYTSSENITAELLARFLEVENYYVLDAVYNSAAEGAAAVYETIGANDALLLYAADAPSLLSPSAGYTFTWEGVSRGIGANIAIQSFEMRHLSAQRVEGQIAWDNAIVAAELGYFFDNAIVLA